MRTVYVVTSVYDGVQQIAARETQLAARRLASAWARGATITKLSPDEYYNENTGWTIAVHEVATTPKRISALQRRLQGMLEQKVKVHNERTA